MDNEQLEQLEAKINAVIDENELNKQRIKILYLLIKDVLTKVESSVLLLGNEDAEKLKKIYTDYFDVIENEHVLLKHTAKHFRDI